MVLTSEVKKSIDNSVLCWLATVSGGLVPNVSPKEVFNYFGANTIIIANIASPNSVKNIRQNENVCLSFIDILVQKGFQLKGKARIVGMKEDEFDEMNQELNKISLGKFPFLSITAIEIDSIKPIIAPKYILYPGTTEQEQIESAIKTYGF